MGAEASAEGCQGALTRKRTLGARGGALQRGHGTPLEPLAQLGDALGSVGTPSSAQPFVSVEAAELVVAQAAREWMSVNGR